MRHQTRSFVAKFLENHGPFSKALDVGSRSVSGDIREVLTKINSYKGLDMIDGDNVNIVMNAHDIKEKMEADSYDLIFCFDTFEHDSAFWITLENIKYILKPGGYLLLGAPGRNCPFHEHPSDYWRFMKPSFVDVFFEDMEDVFIDEQRDDENHPLEDEIYGWGRKKII